MRNFMILRTMPLLLPLLIISALSISVESRAQVSGAEGVPPVSVEQFTQVLWDQTANMTTFGSASQNFTDTGGVNDSFDNRSADDFNIPGPNGWNIETVRAIGFYQLGTSGPAQSLNVVFFADDGGLPGNVVPGCQYNNIQPTNISDPDFFINLPALCALLPGTYWLSVQANMPFNPNGQWFWFTESVQTLNLFTWENPLNGFGSGCTTWKPGINCISDTGPDLTFQFIGEQFVVPRPIPTLSRWGLIAAAGALGLVSLIAVRGRAPRSGA